jgi:hypothetical protein
MVELIVGEKGRGKTKQLLDRVNKAVNSVNGSVVFVDRNTSHMLELDSKIRMVVLNRYPLKTTDNFIGFIYGVISQNKDIEEIYIDGFLQNACIDVNESLESAISDLEDLSDMFNIDFILSVSREKKDLPDLLQDKVVLAL